MIRITVELISARDSSRDRLLGVGYIYNLGDANHQGERIGSYYEARLSKWAPRERETWKSARAVAGKEYDELLHDALVGEVGPFDNVRRGPWDILYVALRAIVGKRNP
jgi:hypothetical protein